MGRPRAPVIAVVAPRGGKDAVPVLGFLPPFGTDLRIVEPWTEVAGAEAVAALAAEDAEVVLVRRPGAPEGFGPATCALDPAEALRFLWFFRDRHDPWTLGHAADRVLLDETWEACRPPPYREGRGATAERAFGEVRSALRTLGRALGVDPPLPAPDMDLGRRVKAALLEAAVGLYAGLLLRWGSPLALLKEVDGGLPELSLADRWLRLRRSGVSPG